MTCCFVLLFSKIAAEHSHDAKMTELSLCEKFLLKITFN